MMRVSVVRSVLLFGSMACTMCLVSIMNYVASDGTKEDQRTVDRLHNVNVIKRRILGGRVLQVSPATGQEYIFSNKSIINRKVPNISLSEAKTAEPVVRTKSGLKANHVKDERKEANDVKISKHEVKSGGNKSLSEAKKAEPVVRTKSGLEANHAKDERKETNDVKISKHEVKSGGNKRDSLKDGVTCRPKRAAGRMENLFGEMFDSSLPPFMTLSALQSASSRRYPLPFGFHGAEGPTRALLQKLPDTGIPEEIKHLPCRRCIVIGNGGLMKGAQLGRQIDKYDAVFRLNTAPVKGFESDVGTKTTVRLVYPESSVLSPEIYAESWTLVVIAFKKLDLQWVDYAIEGRNLSKLAGFWRQTATFVPKPKKDVRLFNPEIITELSSSLIGLKLGKGKMDKNVPTTGAMAIMVALRFCDEVSVAGFGYDLKRPDAPIHYYSDEKMKAISSSWTHNIDPEKKMLQRLVEQGVVHDITGGLRNHI